MQFVGLNIVISISTKHGMNNVKFTFFMTVKVVRWLRPVSHHGCLGAIPVHSVAGRIWMDKVALTQGFLRTLRVFPVLNIPPILLAHMLIVILILLLSE